MRRMPRLTYANVVATLALFVAVGGAGAFAASQLPSKSVGERQLRPGAVTAEKLRKNSVIAPKIMALAVKQGKLANGAVSGAKLANGAVVSEKLGEGAVTTSKLAGDAVTGAKVDESSLGQVPSAARADFATSAESANPAYFARVEANGKIDPAFSKGVGEANARKAAGTYCVGAPGVSPRGAQATAEVNVKDVVVAEAKVNPSGGSCVAPQVEVLTYRAEGGGFILADEPFYVALYR